MLFVSEFQNGTLRIKRKKKEFYNGEIEMPGRIKTRIWNIMAR